VIRAHVPYGDLRPDVSPQGLSRREQDVLGLLAQGLPDRAIADTLAISVKTVEKHVGAVLRKTATRNRTEAAARALDAGWVSS
jgi:DNA-binding NarL/FixJ family response regulator